MTPALGESGDTGVSPEAEEEADEKAAAAAAAGWREVGGVGMRSRCGGSCLIKNIVRVGERFMGRWRKEDTKELS